MNETTTDESSKLDSAKKTLTREEIDKRLENLRKDRLEDKSYTYICKNPFKRTDFFGRPGEPEPPTKLSPAKPSPKRLRVLMRAADRIGYVKLECAHCHKAYPNEPEDYPTDGYVANGSDFVSRFREVGLDAELQYYCPNCVRKYDDPVLDCVYVPGEGRKDGLFVLVLKIQGQILSVTIPHSIYGFKDGVSIRLTTDFEYEYALKFLHNPQITYQDYLEEHPHVNGVWVKLNVDQAMQKVLGVKVDYDDEETLKTFKHLNHYISVLNFLAEISEMVQHKRSQSTAKSNTRVKNKNTVTKTRCTWVPGRTWAPGQNRPGEWSSESSKNKKTEANNDKKK